MACINTHIHTQYTYTHNTHTHMYTHIHNILYTTHTCSNISHAQGIHVQCNYQDKDATFVTWQYTLDVSRTDQHNLLFRQLADQFHLTRCTGFLMEFCNTIEIIETSSPTTNGQESITLPQGNDTTPHTCVQLMRFSADVSVERRFRGGNVSS